MYILYNLDFVYFSSPFCCHSCPYHPLQTYQTSSSIMSVLLSLLPLPHFTDQDGDSSKCRSDIQGTSLTLPVLIPRTRIRGPSLVVPCQSDNICFAYLLSPSSSLFSLYPEGLVCSLEYSRCSLGELCIE